MDFEDHDEHEEEVVALPVGSTYDSPLVKMTGGGADSTAGSGHRKVSGALEKKYRECLKNHAVSLGGHAVDGCGEFMAAGEEGTLDALRCAACNCHRNFHRKAVEGGGGGGEGSGFYQQFSPYYRTPAGYLHHHHLAVAVQHRQAAPLALPSTSGGGGHSRDEDELSDPAGGGGGSGGGSGKKRFRTKFTTEQKDKMLVFADKVGWKIQKHDEAAVEQFCDEACIKRHVLKVWMHNNKHTLGKKPLA